MLACFIGFEVIRHVSPLLHTPLMSLTNALDAIAVVGAIVLVGERKSTFATVLGSDRHCRCHQQRGRRIFYYRSHAQDVQEQPSEQKSQGNKAVI
jgi:hypothetical protein